jgi:hypothetical protein
MTALFSRQATISKQSRPVSTANPAPQAAPSKSLVNYIDGYTYRKLASASQATIAIEEFFHDLVGQDDCSEAVMDYVQQWNNGRSLRSIRDEIARCPQAQSWK